ncbi:hypothetical protein WA026_022677 [Henosepilachna vigintioctopunctata]|uniref:Uncharacterized protein n=1 Tax=Henosepilachna vigintioctopunctata TaxID=420089 RepID=A0AAW1TPK9_9CUCU
MMAVHKYTYYEASLLIKKKNTNNSQVITNDNYNFPQLPKTDIKIINNNLPPTITQQTYAQQTAKHIHTTSTPNLHLINTNKTQKQKTVTTFVTKNRPHKSKLGFNKNKIEECLVDFVPEYKKNKLSDWHRRTIEFQESNPTLGITQINNTMEEEETPLLITSGTPVQSQINDFNQEHMDEIYTTAIIHKVPE